jgi:hypothetical protein
MIHEFIDNAGDIFTFDFSAHGGVIIDLTRGDRSMHNAFRLITDKRVIWRPMTISLCLMKPSIIVSGLSN